MKYFIITLFGLWAATALNAQKLVSPDGKYEIDVRGMRYTVSFEGRTIIQESRLGMDIDNSPSKRHWAYPQPTMPCTGATAWPAQDSNTLSETPYGLPYTASEPSCATITAP